MAAIDGSGATRRDHARSVVRDIDLTDGGDGEGGGAGSDDRDAGARARHRAYQVQLGQRLRSLRRQRGLRLQDVEQRSGGRFKAVVLGSYERGDRAVAAHRLVALAAFYGVPVGELLPGEDRTPRIGGTVRGGLMLRLGPLATDAAVADPELAPLARLAQHLQLRRGDHNGRVLSLRRDDLDTIAVTLGVEAGELPRWLAERGLLAG